MNICEVAWGDHLFEFYPPDGAPREIFNVTMLEQHVRLNPDCAEYLIDELTEDWVEFIRTHRGVDEEALAAITPERLEEPLLAVLRADGTTLTVDGHHRLVRRAQEGRKDYRLIRVKLGHWEWCLVHGIPESVRVCL